MATRRLSRALFFVISVLATLLAFSRPWENESRHDIEGIAGFNHLVLSELIPPTPLPTTPLLHGRNAPSSRTSTPYLILPAIASEVCGENGHQCHATLLHQESPSNSDMRKTTASLVHGAPALPFPTGSLPHTAVGVQCSPKWLPHWRALFASLDLDVRAKFVLFFYVHGPASDVLLDGDAFMQDWSKEGMLAYASTPTSRRAVAARQNNELKGRGAPIADSWTIG